MPGLFTLAISEDNGVWTYFSEQRYNMALFST